MDAVDVRQCVLQFCVRVQRASTNKLLKMYTLPIHLLQASYKKMLKIQLNPINDILPSNYTNRIPVAF